jgi:hypothetical protein
MDNLLNDEDPTCFAQMPFHATDEQRQIFETTVRDKLKSLTEAYRIEQVAHEYASEMFEEMIESGALL